MWDYWMYDYINRDSGRVDVVFRKIDGTKVGDIVELQLDPDAHEEFKKMWDDWDDDLAYIIIAEALRKKGIEGIRTVTKESKGVS